MSSRGVAAAAPTTAAAAAASSSHVDIDAVGRHLPPDCRHEAGAPLMAAPVAVTARGGRCLRCCLRDPPSHGGGVGPTATDVNVASETTTSGAFPPLVPTAVGRGHTPLAAWTNLLLRRSCNDLTLSHDVCVM